MALTYPRLRSLPGAGQGFDSRSPASQGNVLVIGQPQRTALTKLCKVRTLHAQEHPNAKAFAQAGPQETRQPAACPGLRFISLSWDVPEGTASFCPGQHRPADQKDPVPRFTPLLSE